MPGGPYPAVDHVQVVFPAKSGMTKDQIVNTFTFQAGADLGGTEYAAIDGFVGNFYNAASGAQTLPICNYLGAAIARDVNVVVKHFRIEGHLTGTPAGSPAAIGTFGHLGAPLSGSAAAFPSEVAVALAFHGPYAGASEFGPGTPKTRPRSRLRGRIYLGPLLLNAVTWQVESATNRITVGDQFRADLLIAGAKLFNDLRGMSPSVNWCVWSRKNGDIAEISTLTVDDAFDTQRRRGQVPSSRLSATVP